MRLNEDFPSGGSPVTSTLATIPKKPRAIRNICCIGAGYVGGPTCAVLASKCPAVSVNVVDTNEARIAAWNSDELPIAEPHLIETVRLARDGKGNNSERTPNLTFSTDVLGSISRADLIFICVNTPTKTSGVDSGTAMDVGAVEEAARTIAHASSSSKIIVEKSTVPCRTADALRDILAANSQDGVEHTVLSNPEFLAEGTAIRDLEAPDRVLIGCLKSDMPTAAVLADLYAAWVPREKIVTINLWSSELAKISANAFLAQRISSINTLSAVCEATGADIDEIAQCVGLDKRIGHGMLRPSVGFGGSCFRKDVLSLVYLADSLYLPEVAQYWRSVVEVNEWQKNRFVNRILKMLNGTLTDKRIAVLGFAYKKNTGDTRESAAISIVNALVAERAHTTVFDPKVPHKQIHRDLRATSPHHLDIETRVSIAPDPYEACRGAHAVVILTECDEFQALDWKRIAPTMRRPSYVFDGRNIVNPTLLRSLGFRVQSIGKI